MPRLDRRGPIWPEEVDALVGSSLETETLARLYLEQGHPEKAARIFERLLVEDPARKSAAEGLARCRVAMDAGRKDASVNERKKLKALQTLLARLKGEPEPRDESAPDQPKVPMQPPASSQTQRKLELLQAMLRRLAARKP